MKILNISEGKDNFSQRNNEVKPFSSCNTTSLTMATSYIDQLWEIFINSPTYKKYSQFSQPEDRLQQALLDWGLEPTNHYDLQKGYNRFMEKEIDNFSVAAPFRALVDELLAGKPWVGSGTFPGFPNLENKPLGHIICIVGLHYESDPYAPAGVIVDDPYGDTMNNWKGSGNDVIIPWDLFVKWMKPLEDLKGDIFWAHRLKTA
jgi:hypothetical protein